MAGYKANKTIITNKTPIPLNSTVKKTVVGDLSFGNLSGSHPGSEDDFVQVAINYWRKKLHCYSV